MSKLIIENLVETEFENCDICSPEQEIRRVLPKLKTCLLT